MYEPHSKIFDCSFCAASDKKEYGCKRNRRIAIHKFNCSCGGQKGCDICKGHGFFKLKRCPVKYSEDSQTRTILPYFFAWKNGNEFPDGRARLDQPVTLLQAFNILNAICNKLDSEAMERARNKK